MGNDAKIQLRLPIELRDWFAAHCKEHDRSMNGQMIVILKNLMQQNQSTANQEKTK